MILLREAPTPEIARARFDSLWLSFRSDKANAANMINQYYSRVEEANRRFSSTKEGWRTDQGMLYIVLGPPLDVRKTKDRQVWYYDLRGGRRRERVHIPAACSSLMDLSRLHRIRSSASRTTRPSGREWWISGGAGKCFRPGSGTRAFLDRSRLESCRDDGVVLQKSAHCHPDMFLVRICAGLCTGPDWNHVGTTAGSFLEGLVEGGAPVRPGLHPALLASPLQSGYLAI